MADLPFTVKHFIVCQSVQWEGVPGPNAKRNLEGVGYRLMMDPGQEPPFLLDELWFFVRVYRQSERDQTLRLRLVTRRIFPLSRRIQRVNHLDRVLLRKDVADFAWPIRPFEFPHAGQYEFRLQYWNRAEIGLRWKTIARDFALIEERR